MSTFFYKYLIKFTLYLLNKAVTPKTLINRWIKTKIIRYLDVNFLEVRTVYLTHFIKFEEQFISFPRKLNNDVVTSFLIKRKAKPGGAPLLALVSASGADPTFIAKVNLALEACHVSYLDYDSQVAYSDVWDHLTYGMMVATVAIELGSVSGTPGQINEARLGLLVKEPPVKKSGVKLEPSGKEAVSNPVKNTEKPPFSCGPFQIYEPFWKSISGYSLPSTNFYIHGALFFKHALYADSMVRTAWKKQLVPFKDRDPEWLTNLYARRDMLGYLLLWRRYYGGAGSYYTIEDPNNPGKMLDGDAFCFRNLAFALTALSVMDVRGGLNRAYPAHSTDKSDESLFKILIEANPELET